MAGGSGSRLMLGEKPLVQISGNPMISYVISAFENAGYEVLIVASHRTPYTVNWAKVQGFECFRASGHGYISDLQEAVRGIEESAPLFTCGADLPCITAEHIEQIRFKYEESGKEALSVWVPRPSTEEKGTTSYFECIQGVEACPAGINILRGDLIDRPQEEEQLLIKDCLLGYNINTRADLQKLRQILTLSHQ
jgi:adenosylcobinamide-phosphate guanylyltransferase